MRLKSTAERNDFNLPFLSIRQRGQTKRGPGGKQNGGAGVIRVGRPWPPKTRGDWPRHPRSRPKSARSSPARTIPSGISANQIARPKKRTHKNAETTPPTVNAASMPKWASSLRTCTSRLPVPYSAPYSDTPACRMWLVQKVVAIGMPWACRKVLYCMEQIKLMSTWVICTGADSGRTPKNATAAISKSTSAVSQRM